MSNTSMKYSNLDLGTIEATFNVLGGIEGAARLRRGELVLVEAPKLKVASDLPPDFLVRVNRKDRPPYPDWMKKLLHPELEGLGPSEYNLSNDVVPWLSEVQTQGGVVRGLKIYVSLRKSNNLINCLGFDDLLAIKAMGLPVFRKFFKGKTIFGWRSVGEDQGGAKDQAADLRVPCLEEKREDLVLQWVWIGHDFGPNDPALLFKNHK